MAVTREKCPGCEKQKPLFEKLSNRMKEKYGDQVEFLRVHARFSQEQKEEAKQCADAFHTVGFPTYIIGIKDSEGNNLETYRALESPMKEIKRTSSLALKSPNGSNPKRSEM